VKPNDTFHAFSNGTEWQIWLDNNCQRGKGGCRNYNPNAATSRDGCPMEVALALASLKDGQIKAKHGLRCGLCVPGDNGEIVTTYPPLRCPEYRGYDEPDDRPRRGPRPPEGQLDVFDPRNAPERSTVPA
jgi:hypothetical protein